MSIERQRIGKLGEAETARRFIQSGLTILSLNWRCRSGEIDLIARDGEIIVFVEVRSRSASSGMKFGMAAESVDVRKQMKIRSVAQTYLKQHQLQQSRIRFDVVTITIGRGNEVELYRHYEAAF
ncbi:YraN family protein [Paenibacillus sp. strain BS8-2]